MIKPGLLIIRAGALGDTLMLMPSIDALKEDHLITVMGRQPGISYLEPFADKCIDMERGGWHKLFTGGVKSGSGLPYADRVAAFVTDPDNIISENLKRAMPGSRIKFFPPFPDHEHRIHVSLYTACAIQSAGIQFNPRSAFDEAFKKPLLQEQKISGKKIVLHPGSGSKGKNYFFEIWSGLLSVIKRESFSRMSDVHFLLGPAEEDIEEKVRKIALEYNVKIIKCPEKKDLLSILNSSCLYIGHDSGITHLAAMLGVNTVAMFKGSSIDQWRPLGPAVKVIGPESDDMILKKVIREFRSLVIGH